MPPDPLRLGKHGGDPYLIAEVCDDDLAHLRVTTGAPEMTLTRRGANHLGKWLLEWGQPRRRKLKLWGTAEILEQIRINSATLHEWRKRRDFPKPLAVLKAGPVWDAAHVKAWVRYDRPKRGRPPIRQRSQKKRPSTRKDV